MKFLVKKEFLIFLLISIIASLVVGFRGATNDTYTYYSIFKNINNYDLKLSDFNKFYIETGMEIGWGWYSKIISFFTSSSIPLFTIYSFLIFSILYKISQNINLKYIYIMCFYLPSGFFFLQQFMQIRQALAVPLVIYASVLFLNNKKILSLIFFILAISFHQITVVFIFIFLVYLLLDKYYPLFYSELRFKFLNIFILIFGLFTVRFIIFPIAFSTFERLQTYSNTEYGDEIGLFSLANIKFYIEFIAIILLTNRKLISNKFYVFMVFIFTIGLTLRISFYDFAILSGRLSNVFLLIEIFLIPMLFWYRLKTIYFYLFLMFYFILIFYVTWFFQAAEYLEKAYFIPLI